MYIRQLKINDKELLTELNTKGNNKYYSINLEKLKDLKPEAKILFIATKICLMSYKISNSKEDYFAVIDVRNIKAVQQRTWYDHKGKYLKSFSNTGENHGYYLHTFIKQTKHSKDIIHHLGHQFDHRECSLKPMTEKEHRQLGQHRHSDGEYVVDSIEAMLYLLNHL